MIAIDVSGSGEPLVLFHGVGASRIVWRHVTPLLAPRRLVIAPDLPGFGESAPAGPGFDLETTAAALAEPLAEQAGGRFDLVGNSLGGAVAVELAALRPDLIRRLVLSAPAGFTAPKPALADVAGALLGPLTTLRREIGVPLAASPTARSVLLFGAIAEPRRLSASDARIMLEASRGSTRIGAAVETLLSSDLSPVLEHVEAPVGVIWGPTTGSSRSPRSSGFARSVTTSRSRSSTTRRTSPSSSIRSSSSRRWSACSISSARQRLGHTGVVARPYADLQGN